MPLCRPGEKELFEWKKKKEGEEKREIFGKTGIVGSAKYPYLKDEGMSPRPRKSPLGIKGGVFY